jgi:hypothetical protein
MKETPDNQNSQEDANYRIMMNQLKQEARKEKFWLYLTKYKKELFIFLSFILIVIISVSFYNFDKKSKNIEYSKLLHQALVSEEYSKDKSAEEILAKIKNSESSPVNLKSLAMLKQASKLIKDSKIKEAVKVYLEVNNFKKADTYLRELSALFALKTMIDFDYKAFDKKIIEILPEIEKNTIMLKPFIIEQKAIFLLLKGQKEESKKMFKNIDLDPESPEFLKKRAREFLYIFESK